MSVKLSISIINERAEKIIEEWEIRNDSLNIISRRLRFGLSAIYERADVHLVKRLKEIAQINLKNSKKKIDIGMERSIKKRSIFNPRLKQQLTDFVKKRKEEGLL